VRTHLRTTTYSGRGRCDAVCSCRPGAADTAASDGDLVKVTTETDRAVAQYADTRHGLSHRLSCLECLLHDLLSSPISHHCVWSDITGHNLTPEKHDNNYSPTL